MNARPATHRVRLFLRDFRVVDASLAITENQSLAGFLSNRRNYMNLLHASWADGGAPMEHLMLRVGQILWAHAADQDVPVSGAPISAPSRHVELNLEGGQVIRAALNVGTGQRLSDYLEAAASFIPLHHATLMKSARAYSDVNVELGDVVVSQAGLLAVREIEAAGP
jgi:hypothetical protein